MKLLTTALILFSVPMSAFASDYTGAKLIEAKAVLNSKEIASLLAFEKKTHKLKCERETLSDVKISDDADMDAFTISYGCSRGDDTVQRIDFSGGVYTSSPTSTTADVVLTQMQLELGE